MILGKYVTLYYTDLQQSLSLFHIVLGQSTRHIRGNAAALQYQKTVFINGIPHSAAPATSQQKQAFVRFTLPGGTQLPFFCKDFIQRFLSLFHNIRCPLWFIDNLRCEDIGARAAFGLEIFFLFGRKAIILCRRISLPGQRHEICDTVEPVHPLLLIRPKFWPTSMDGRMLRQDMLDGKELLIVRCSTVTHERVQPLDDVVAALRCHRINLAIQCLPEMFFFPIRKLNVSQRRGQCAVGPTLHLHQKPFVPVHTMVDVLRCHKQIRCQPFQLSDKPENIFRIIRVLCEKFDSRRHPVGVVCLVQPEKQTVYLVRMMCSSELAIF